MLMFDKGIGLALDEDAVRRMLLTNPQLKKIQLEQKHALNLNF